MTVDAPKYGDSSRTAAISAPSDAIPTTKTRSASGGIPTGTVARVGRGGSRSGGSDVSLASVHAAARVGARGTAHHRAGRGRRSDRRRRPPLHRRGLVALVQRPWPPASPYRRRATHPALRRGPLDDAGPQPSPG